MFKSIAVWALVMGASAIEVRQNWAQGQAEDEWNGEVIRVNGPTKMESYETVQTDAHRIRVDSKKEASMFNKFLRSHDHSGHSQHEQHNLDSSHFHQHKHAHKRHGHSDDSLVQLDRIKAHSQKEAALFNRFIKEHDHTTKSAAGHKQKNQKLHKKHKKEQNDDDFAEGLTDAEHDFKTTIRMKEPEGLRPYSYQQKKSRKHHNEDFAEGLTDAEHDFKTTIRMKEPEGLRPYHYGQKEDNNEEDFAEGLTDAEHDFKTTIRMKEPEGLRPYHYAQKHHHHKSSDEFAEGLNDKEHDFQTTIRMKEPEGLRPYQYVSVDEEPKKEAAAAPSRPAGAPVRGEKEWQDWAQNLINHEDFLTAKANTRIPYFSTVQLEDENLVHISNEEGDELIKMETPHSVPLNFRF